MGRAEDFIEASSVLTAAEIWMRAAGDKPMPPNTLVAVNMEYAPLSREVKNGDEVAFFPPVTGG